MTETIHTPSNKEQESQSFDALLVFGQGPILDRDTRIFALVF